MGRETYVHAELNGAAHLVGRLFTRVRGRRETATFEYDEAWLGHGERFALEPALQLGPGPFHAAADKPLFGAIGDSAPDRWGRVLMRRTERRRAAAAGEAARTLFEIDYLLLVNDEARMGALRFADRPGGPFLAPTSRPPVPPLVDLPRLLSAAERVVDKNEDNEDLRLLFAPGSSLGGARPKASVREPDGRLAIAKFPHKDDEWNVVLWEAAALSLADKARIDVPPFRVEKIAGKEVLILARFDREKRRALASAPPNLNVWNRPLHTLTLRLRALWPDPLALPRLIAMSPRFSTTYWMASLWLRIITASLRSLPVASSPNRIRIASRRTLQR